MQTKTFDLGGQSVKIKRFINKTINCISHCRHRGYCNLATLVADKNDSDRDFFPLTVDYIEKTYAAGKIPGGLNEKDDQVKKRP